MELALKYNRSERWIREKIHSYQPVLRKREAREVVLVLDATFFGKRKEKFGLLIAKDIHSKAVVSYHFIESETNKEYIALRADIKRQGYVIKSVIIDGKRGLFSLFEDVPIQMCQFHQQAIITCYLTKNPKLEASIQPGFPDTQRVFSESSHFMVVKF